MIFGWWKDRKSRERLGLVLLVGIEKYIRIRIGIWQ